MLDRKEQATPQPWQQIVYRSLLCSLISFLHYAIDTPHTGRTTKIDRTVFFSISSTGLHVSYHVQCTAFRVGTTDSILQRCWRNTYQCAMSKQAIGRIGMNQHARMNSFPQPTGKVQNLGSGSFRLHAGRSECVHCSKG